MKNISGNPFSQFIDLEGFNLGLSILAAIFSSIAIIANITLFLVIIRSRVLQTPTNLFIASLTIGELLVGCFAIPFASSSIAVNSWSFSEDVCTLSAAIQVIGRGTSAYSLLAVCFDRCVAVSKPLKYSHIITFKVAWSLLSYVWLQSIVVALLPLGNWGHYVYSNLFFLCILTHSPSGNEPITKEIICAFIPSILIIIFLVVIIKEVKSHHRIFAIVPLPLPGQVTENVTLPGLLPAMRGFNRGTMKAMRSLFVITGAFLVFTAPKSIVLVLVEYSKDGLHPVFIFVTVWLSFIGCIINPIIIIAFSRKFRAQLKIALAPFRCKPLRASKEVFTISTGLHTILDATLVLNMVKNEHASTTTSTRRRILGVTSGQ